MQQETVILPEPGRSLLHRTYAILSRRLRSTAGLAGFIIGGGTMLAARWGHRTSKDIDVKVNNTEGFRCISRMYEEPTLQEMLDREMHQAGAWGRNRDGAFQLVYSFGDRDDPDPPRVDLAELAPKLRGEVIRTHSEGMEFWSATNAEILAGKWMDRRHHVLVRDVFDIATAAVMDPPALQRAIAVAADGEDLDIVIESLAREREALKASAAEEISAVPTDLEWIHEDPARWAARGIGLWTPTEVSITRVEESWVTATRCRMEPEGTIRVQDRSLDRASRHAVEFGGLDNEQAERIKSEADRHGGGAWECAGATMKQCTAPDMRVDGRGRVTMRDFGEEATIAPTIAAATEIAIERGWSAPESREQTMEELRELQQEAIAREHPGEH